MARQSPSAAPTGEGTRTDAPPASGRIRVDFIKIDYWSGETASLQVDGTEVWSHAFEPRQEQDFEDLCGEESFSEEIVTIDVTVPHTDRELLLDFVINNMTRLNATGDAGWWGLRDMSVKSLPLGYAWREVNVSGMIPPARAHHASASFQVTASVSCVIACVHRELARL